MTAGGDGFLADLHTHSTASDGLDSPAALVKLASERGISVLALTDHDTVAGVDEAHAASRQCGLRFIAGVEFSTRARRGQTHILGYGIDVHDPSLLAQLHTLQSGREERGILIVERLRSLGIDLPEEVAVPDSSGNSPGRPHIARAMIEAGIVETVSQAFEEYLAVGRPAFVPREVLLAEAAIDLIQRAGGIAVLAHPLSVHRLEERIPDLIDAGLEGLEAYYAEYRQEERESLASLAMKYNLLVTGGSDYHGDAGVSSRILGSVDWPKEALDAVLVRLK